MHRILAAGFALSALVVTASSNNANASNCATDIYGHNGSQMEVIWCDEGVNIAYDRPRSGLRKHGVNSGTILFEGQSNGIAIYGTARVFNRICGEAAYEVEGDITANRIVMRGKAPVRDTSTCGIKRYRDDTMVFDLMAQ